MPYTATHKAQTRARIVESARVLFSRKGSEQMSIDDIIDDVDQHCPLIAVLSDVARAGLEPRAAYTFIVRGMLDVFRAAFGMSDPDATVKAASS